jgi:hypothetical protein
LFLSPTLTAAACAFSIHSRFCDPPWTRGQPSRLHPRPQIGPEVLAVPQAGVGWFQLGDLDIRNARQFAPTMGFGAGIGAMKLIGKQEPGVGIRPLKLICKQSTRHSRFQIPFHWIRSKRDPNPVQELA